MQGESALQFFEKHAAAEDRMKALQGLHERVQLAWECEKVSRYSPGPVQNDEMLVRTFDQPTHYRDGKILPAAFTDIASRGLSCNRLNYTTVDESLTRSSHRVAAANVRSGSDRRTIAYATYSVDYLRDLTCYEGAQCRRALAVYDTAYEVDPSHADICLLVSDKQVERRLRSSLFTATTTALTLVDS